MRPDAQNQIMTNSIKLLNPNYNGHLISCLYPTRWTTHILSKQIRKGIYWRLLELVAEQNKI